MEWLINRRRMMYNKAVPPSYLTFEDAEAWRLCCINWGDYNETVITAGDNNTVDIVVTFKSKLNNTVKRSVIIDTQEGVDNSQGTYIEGTTKEPVGITQKQCSAVTSFGTVFRYCNAVYLDDLAYFDNVTSLTNYAFADSPNLYSITLPNKLKSIVNGGGNNCINNCPNLKILKTLSDTFTVSAQMCAVSQSIIWKCKELPAGVDSYNDNYYIYNDVDEQPLPQGYTRKQYIETNRASYINTGITANNTLAILTDLEVEQYLTAIDNNKIKNIISAYSGSTKFYLIFSNRVNAIYYVTSNSTGWTGTMNIAFDTKSRLYLSKSTYAMVYQNTRKRDKSEIGTLGTLYIGGNADGPCEWHNLKFGEVFVMQDNTIVLHYIPCTNNNGVYGMWDAINGEFVGSSTETPFTGA